MSRMSLFGELPDMVLPKIVPKLPIIQDLVIFVKRHIWYITPRSTTCIWLQGYFWQNQYGSSPNCDQIRCCMSECEFILKKDLLYALKSFMVKLWKLLHYLLHFWHTLRCTNYFKKNPISLISLDCLTWQIGENLVWIYIILN